MGQATDVAAALLGALGHEPAVNAIPTTPLEDWIATGLATRFSASTQDPRVAQGRPATVARGATLAMSAIARTQTSNEFLADGAELLGRRAALSNIAADSPGPGATVRGHARLLRAADTWWALNLARPDDLDLVPALIEDEPQSPWPDIERWSGTMTAREAVDRAVMIGMPAAVLRETPAPRLPWSISSAPASTQSRGRTLVNLGSLWAAPLAAHLLAQLRFEIIHVESVDRPDASRWGDPEFYAELRRGTEVRSIDFATRAGRAELRELVSSADVVIEASRPRALEYLGVAPRDVMLDGRARTWLQITGHGPDQPHRVAFGDDAAIAGGLVLRDAARQPYFYGDAVADPLTGILGALAIIGVHTADRSTVVTTSLARSAAYARTIGNIILRV